RPSARIKLSGVPSDRDPGFIETLLLPAGCRSALARDLPGTGSKSCACGVSGTTESPDFAAAARQIAGKRAPTGGCVNLIALLFDINGPDTTNRDLGVWPAAV
ncbi:hypothetical protein, partial [Pseudomonas abietaniphila]